MRTATLLLGVGVIEETFNLDPEQSQFLGAMFYRYNQFSGNGAVYYVLHGYDLEATEGSGRRRLDHHHMDVMTTDRKMVFVIHKYLRSGQEVEAGR
jgi:hypothetical protein